MTSSRDSQSNSRQRVSIGYLRDKLPGHRWKLVGDHQFICLFCKMMVFATKKQLKRAHCDSSVTIDHETFSLKVPPIERTCENEIIRRVIGG